MNPFYGAPTDPASSFIDNLFRNPGLAFLFIIAFILLLFLIFREIVCWYWKINERLDVLYDIRKELSILNKSVARMEHEKDLQASSSETPPSEPQH